MILEILFRSFSICSSYKKFREEIVRLKEIFKRNSYPEEIQDRRMKNFLNKSRVLKAVGLTAAKKELILALSYLGQQSFEIRLGSSSVKKTTFQAIYF